MESINVALAGQLLKQNDPAFPEDVRRFACRYFTLLAIPQLTIGKPLTRDQVLTLKTRAEGVPDVMEPNVKMGKEEHRVINWAFEALGRPELRGRQVGRMKGEAPIFWNEVQPFQWVIGHWDTGGVDGHWCLFLPDGTEVYDPWNPRLSYALTKKAVDKRLLYRVWEITA